MNLNYCWIILSIISTASYFVLTSAFMRKNEGVGIHFILAITHGIAALILAAFLDTSIIQSMSVSLWRSLLIFALLTWLAKIFYFYAYNHTSVANVTVFSALTPVYAVMLSPIMGYSIKPLEVVGVLIITSSVFIFFAKDIISQATRKNRLPLKLPSLAIICAFLSTIPTALAVYFQKDAITSSNPLFVSFFVCAFSALASLAYCILRPSSKRPEYINSFMPLFSIATLQAVAAITFSMFIAHEHPAIGQTLQRLSSLLQILLAHIFLRQRLNTVWHILCVCISIVGIYVLRFT